MNEVGIEGRLAGWAGLGSWEHLGPRLRCWALGPSSGAEGSHWPQCGDWGGGTERGESKVFVGETWVRDGGSGGATLLPSEVLALLGGNPGCEQHPAAIRTEGVPRALGLYTSMPWTLSVQALSGDSAHGEVADLPPRGEGR